MLIGIFLIVTLSGCTGHKRVVTPDGFVLAHWQWERSDYYVIDYSGEETEIVIPLEYEGRPIVALGRFPFPFHIPFSLKKNYISKKHNTD